MKTLLASLLYLLTFTSAHAQAWPRNPTTNEVEFNGVMPWPASVKTEAQRQVLLRRWYLAKLTDLTPAEVEAQTATNKSTGLLTYAGLPKATVLRQGKGVDEYLLGCFVRLSPASTGLTYSISILGFDKASEAASHEPTPLEQLLPNATPSERAALAALHKRLTAAIASW